MVVTAASVTDNQIGTDLLDKVVEYTPSVTRAYVDAGFQDDVMIHGAVLGITVEQVKRSDTRPGFVPVAHRWVVERTHGTLMPHRRLVREYEIRPASRRPSQAEARLSPSHVVLSLARAGRIRETAPMPAEYTQSDQFRGARIHLCDLSGLEIRDCDVTGLKIVDCYGGNVSLGGGFERVVVNDVDVTAYVEAELDRLHPNRVLAREATSAAEYRAAWDAIEKQWEETLDRARRLPEAKLHEQVDGEWSFVETQRHLLMASDAWIGNAVLEEDAPYHPLGLPSGGMPAEASAKLGLTLDATPTLDEVLAPRLARMATMRRVVDELTEAELDRVCGRKPADPYPDREYVVRRCLTVVCKEEAEHHRYAVRDLTVLEADTRTG